MPANRENFNKIYETTASLIDGNTLGKQYGEGVLSLEKIQELSQKEQHNFWDFLDFIGYLSQEDTSALSWATEQAIKQADDTYTHITLLRSFPLTDRETRDAEENARRLAKDTEDFLELDDMGLFQERDITRLMESPRTMEDRVELYNFLEEKAGYESVFINYKKEFTSQIQTLDDFMEVYAHINNEELRDKVKSAIEELTGIKLQ